MKNLPFLVLALLVGCGDDVWDVPIDGPREIDAPEPCGVSSVDFGDLGELPGFAGMQNAPDNGLATAIIPLTPGSPNDRLVFQVWGSPGAPIAAGTFQLTGANAAVETCRACAAIGAQWSLGSPLNQRHLYLAHGGTAVVSLVEPSPGGRFEFELSDLVLQHVRITDGASVPVGDGCVTAVGRISFRGNFDGSSSVAPDDQVRISPADLGLDIHVNKLLP